MGLHFLFHLFQFLQFQLRPLKIPPYIILFLKTGFDQRAVGIDAGLVPGRAFFEVHAQFRRQRASHKKLDDRIHNRHQLYHVKQKGQARFPGLALYSFTAFRRQLVDDRAHLLRDRRLNCFASDVHLDARIARRCALSIDTVFQRRARRHVLYRCECHCLTRDIALCVAGCSDWRDLAWEIDADSYIRISFLALVDDGDDIACCLADANWVFGIRHADVQSRTPFPTSCELCAGVAALAVCDVHAVGEAARCAGRQSQCERGFFAWLHLSQAPYGLIAIHGCALRRHNRSRIWSDICHGHFCQRLVAWVGDCDLVIGFLANHLLFRTCLRDVNSAAGNICAPLAGDRVRIACCDDSCVADFAALCSGEAKVDLLCLAGFKCAQFVRERSQAAAVLKSIWNLVSYDHIFSSAAAAVCDCNGVVHGIAWANFFWAALFAGKDRLSAEQRAESHRNSCRAEASALLAFALALDPQFSWAAFAFSHGADVPYDAAAFHFCFWRASYISNTLWKVCDDNNVADIIACFDVEFERILVAQHAHAWVPC